ncbi:MAG: signal peptidase I [Patescibacteria group bacterium]
MKKLIPVSIIGGAAIVVLVIYSNVYVSGTSMEPNVHAGLYSVDRLSYKFRVPERGEIVFLDSPIDNRNFVKRIVGLPNEKVVINGGEIIIYNYSHPNGFKLDESYLGYCWMGDFISRASYSLTSDDYLVFGDNRADSLDSRVFGPIKGEAITAKLIVR